MRVGVFAPYLETYGGGEKYICRIASQLSRKWDVEFMVFRIPNISQLERRMNVQLGKVLFRRIEKTYSPIHIPLLGRFAELRGISSKTGDYDLFLNQENNTLIPSLASKSVHVCQLPERDFGANRIFLPLPRNWVDAELRTYQQIITYSCFNREHIKKWFPEKKISVLYPPIDVDQFIPLPKKPIILSVGRFFAGGHCKKQLEMIRVFKGLCNCPQGLAGWQYHLVGGVGATASSQRYFNRCVAEAKGFPVYFHPNVSFGELRRYYGESQIFWHATGMGESEGVHPERMEHFGMTTAEAMSAGCVPIVIDEGGQPEIVRDCVDGFLWNTIEDLKRQTLMVADDEHLRESMAESSVSRSREFDNGKFVERVEKIFSDLAI